MGAEPPVVRFYDDSFASLMAASPEVCAELGLREIGGRPLAQDRWSDLSAAGDAHRRALLQQALAQLSSMPDGVDRAIYGFFLRYACFGRLRGIECPELCDPVADHLDGAQTEIITCLAQWHPLATAEDAEAFRQRVAAVPKQIDVLIDALRTRTAAGNTMPTCVVSRVVAEIQGFLECPLARNPIARRLPRSMSDVERGIYPAYARLLDFLSTQYPREERVGLWRMPRGSEFYRFLLKARTTTALSPDEIHELGRSEAQRLQAELDEKLRARGYAGAGFADRYRAFDADPKFRLDLDRKSLVSLIDQIIRDTERGIGHLFGLKPRARVIAQAVPEMQEANRHAAYVPPAADGSRPGVFDVNVAQLKAQGRPGLYTTIYHETFPGHHVQLTIAQELGARLPAFRRVLVHDAYIEGWAKYAELLPWLEGLNTDPDWDIARRRSELVSTANLVLDTGIHEQRWTRAQGIAFLLENTGCDGGFAEYLVDRVIARPAQVCAYKIGMITVLRARERMQQALGARFDVRRFHDAVLGQGSLPLTLLDATVDQVIAESRA